MLLALAGVTGITILGGDAIAAPPPCPGPGKTPPAGCAPPSDKQCADATSPYSSTKNPACADAWAEHCACVNTTAFNNARTPLATPANLERAPSPTKTVYAADQKNNSVHVSNYGIKTDWLKGAPPNAGAARVNTSISGVQALNVSDPPTVAAMVHRANVGKSQNFGQPVVKRGPKAIPKSMQNIWSAHETHAAAEAVYKACPGKTGQDLVTCALGYQRPLGAKPPKLDTCEDFVFNRFYDVERFHDHMAACRGDISCRAAIALDPNEGVAGRLLGGSDVDPSKQGDLKKLLAAFDNNTPPSCDTKPISADDLHLCEVAGSMPPLAYVKPDYFGPISGGGSAVSFVTSDGSITSGFGLAINNQKSVGYWVSKNPYYDAASIVTPLVMQSFSSDAAKFASVVRLSQEVKKGSYYVGKYFNGKPPAGGQVASYPSEWHYNRAMHNAVKSRPVRAIRDFEKRKNFLKQRGDTFNALYWSLPSNQIHFKIPVDANISAATPALGGGLGAPQATLVQSAMHAQMKPTVRGAAPTMQKARLMSLTPAKPTDLDVRAWGRGGKPPPLDPAYKYPRLLCTSPDKLQAGYAARQVGVSPSTGPALPATPINGPAMNHAPSPTTQADVTTAACNMVNAVLDEWARADSPKILAPTDVNPLPASTGCFANDAACDWDPATFVHGIEDLVNSQIDNVQASQREADYKACRAWQPEISSPANIKKYSDQKTGELVMLGDIKTEIQSLFNQIADVPVLEHGGPWSAAHPSPTGWAGRVPMHGETGDSYATFGEDRHNAETWGNDLFGVGYSYDIGWEVPVRWEQTQPKGQYQVCDFGLGAHGGFEAWAFAFGSDKFDILETDIVAGAHDYTNPSVPGAADDVDNNLHEAAFDAHFTVAGDTLISEDLKVGLNVTHNIPISMGSNSWTLFTIPFQISFVTLEVSVGVGYSYEVDMTATPYHTNVCHDGKKDTNGYPWPSKAGPPKIGLTTTLRPQAELDGIVDAYASIAGLAGIGVDVNLTLLGIGLPVTNTINLDPSNLNIDSSLNMDFHTLDGSLSMYAELLFFTLFDVEIMSWDGFHSSIPLFNTSEKVDLGVLGKLGASGLSNPAKSLQGL